MANSSEGLMAGFSGRIGGMVIFQSMGKTVVRSMPTGKRKPAKGAQKKAQNDFAVMMKIMQAIKPFIKEGFKDVSEGRSAFHTALSENIKRRLQSDQPERLHWLLVSQGERAGATSLKAQCADNNATVTWDAAPAGKISSPDDLVMLLALNTVTLACTCNPGTSSRSKGVAQLDLPSALPGEEILVFVAFRSINIAEKKSVKNVSESQLLIVNC